MNIKYKFANDEIIKSLVSANFPVATIPDVEAPMWGSIKNFCPEPYDQGEEGCCIIHAFSMMILLSYAVKGINFKPSRSGLHFLMVSENINVAEAAMIKLYSEDYWPFTSEHLIKNLEENCETKCISSYKIIPIDKKIIKNIEKLISGKFPVFCLIRVYASFVSPKSLSTGMIKVPNPVHWEDEEDPKDKYLGIHALCIVGYSHSKQLFTVINSFGNNFGSGGYCYIPYSYIIKLTVCAGICET